MTKFRNKVIRLQIPNFKTDISKYVLLLKLPLCALYESVHKGLIS